MKNPGRRQNFCATLAAQKAEQNVMSLLQNAHPLVLHFWKRCTLCQTKLTFTAFYANIWRRNGQL